MLKNLFGQKRVYRHSMIITRHISEMESVQFTMTADDPAEFMDYMKKAEEAAQWRADDFQQKLKEAEAVKQAEIEARKGKK